MCNDEFVFGPVPPLSVVTVLVGPADGEFAADAAVHSNQHPDESWPDEELRVGRRRTMAAGERLVVDVRAANATNATIATAITVMLEGPNGEPLVPPAVSRCQLAPARHHVCTVDVEAAPGSDGPTFEAIAPRRVKARPSNAVPSATVKKPAVVSKSTAARRPGKKASPKSPRKTPKKPTKRGDP